MSLIYVCKGNEFRHNHILPPPEITFINIINSYCHCADPTSKHKNNIKQSIFCGLSNTTNLAFPY